MRGDREDAVRRDLEGVVDTTMRRGNDTRKDRNLDIHMLLADVAYTCLRDANAELAAYQVALQGADQHSAQRARRALTEALDVYGKARELRRLLTMEEGDGEPAG